MKRYQRVNEYCMNALHPLTSWSAVIIWSWWSIDMYRPYFTDHISFPSLSTTVVLIADPYPQNDFFFSCFVCSFTHKAIHVKQILEDGAFCHPATPNQSSKQVPHWDVARLAATQRKAASVFVYRLQCRSFMVNLRAKPKGSSMSF